LGWLRALPSDTVRLTPSYGRRAPLTIDGEAGDQAVPVTRQRRRLEAMLAGLDEPQWNSASRCGGWSVQDVVAHLAGVNAFWEASVRAGLAGSPTQVLAQFDPVAHPPQLIEPLRGLAPADVLEQFARSNAVLLDALASLRDGDWEVLAESPVGHVSMRLLAHHALWDCWVHERDIAIPLGLAAVVEPDEVTSCLRYAAALGPVLALSWPEDRRVEGAFGVTATAPGCAMTITIGSEVRVFRGAPPATAPCLRGDAAALVEALSVRAELPGDTPPEWHALVGSLATVFDQ
jgi:uncharacterized protein (TIGR03083 family)